ncbi:MAG TPA: hypothetical protein VHA74_00475, partial [Candidatus Dojkabacteria bacterium]|nr:hypothetical protein [Candidatus Dojkabacteria bacterium]
MFTYGKKPEGIVVFEELRHPLVMQILVPRENDKTPLAAEQMFASLHGIMRDAKKSLDSVSFEVVSVGGEGIRFMVIAPQHLAQFVEGQIYAQYPNAEIKYVQDYTKEKRGNVYISTGIIELEKDYIFPIKTFRNFEVDPLAAITSAISDLKGNEEAWIQMVVRPIANYWQERSKKYISAIKEGKSLDGVSIIDILTGFVSGIGKALQTDGTKSPAKEVVRLQPGQQEELTQVETKMLKLGFEVVFRVVTKSPDQIRSEQILRDIVASFKQFTTAHLNSLIHSAPDVTAQTIYQNYIDRKLPAETHDTLNIEELASVYHLPNISVETPNIVWSRARKAEPPMDLPIDKNDKGINIFGQADYRGIRTEFGLKKEDRRRHFYLLGKTGVGKSTLFKNMFISDVLAGSGACFIDPHGDTVEELLDFIPESR